MALTTTPNLNTTAHITSHIETMIGNKQRPTVKAIAESAGMTIAKVRKILVDHYGTRITFTKGRTGGIMLS